MQWIVYKQRHSNAVDKGSQIGQAEYTHCSCAETLFVSKHNLPSGAALQQHYMPPAGALAWPNSEFVFECCFSVPYQRLISNLALYQVLHLLLPWHELRLLYPDHQLPWEHSSSAVPWASGHGPTHNAYPCWHAPCSLRVPSLAHKTDNKCNQWQVEDKTAPSSLDRCA